MKKQFDMTGFLLTHGKRTGWLVCFCLFFIPAVRAQPAGSRVAAASRSILSHNPVLDIDFPDPTVIRVKGMYYAYATQARHNGKMVNIQVASSPDMIHWNYVGDALPQKPVWASNTQDFWAPHVLYDSAMNRFVMFFCAKTTDTATDRAIGVAYADNPEGPFADKGSPLLAGKGFATIDPMAMQDPATGKKLMYWGSGFAPIVVQELSDDWSSLKEGSTAIALLQPGGEKDYTKLIEGAWVDYHNGTYFLYYSGDNCCGDGANYAVMVARSDNAMGPFTTWGEVNGRGSSVILQKDSTWLAPGHNSIFTDEKGNSYMAYHAIWRNKEKAGQPSGNDHYLKRVMCIAPLSYVGGWPVVVRRK